MTCHNKCCLSERKLLVLCFSRDARLLVLYFSRDARLLVPAKSIRSIINGPGNIKTASCNATGTKVSFILSKVYCDLSDCLIFCFQLLCNVSRICVLILGSLNSHCNFFADFSHPHTTAMCSPDW